MLSAYLSIVFAIVFTVILISLHFLKRELDPSWRMISEYEIGRFGWLMRVAFFSWGASILALLIAIWPALLGTSGTITRGWFILIAIAMFGAGIFKTDPITDQTNRLVNTIHGMCGVTVILTFPIAATIAVRSLLYDPRWSANQGLLILLTVLTWVGMVVYFASVISARMKDPKAGEKGGPIVYMGWSNRFNVLTYMLWIVIVAMIALRV